MTGTGEGRPKQASPSVRGLVAAGIVVFLGPAAGLDISNAVKDGGAGGVVLAGLGLVLMVATAAGAWLGKRWSYSVLLFAIPAVIFQIVARTGARLDGMDWVAVGAWSLAFTMALKLKATLDGHFMPDLPPAAATAAEPRRRRSPDPLEWTRDNIEAIVVAFLMALIIRCFCVEVFKIPTGSMEPTLYGDTKPTDKVQHQGDRIMVDKVGLMLESVDRFDVCVFRYPLDRSRNFIKRLVGLPNEDLKIDLGDIWTRPHSGGDGLFHIARKPAREQAGIWLQAWPVEATDAEAQRKAWDGAPKASYLGDNRFDTAAAQGNATFHFQHIIDGKYHEMGRGERVNDLVLRCDAVFAQNTGEMFARINRGDGFGSFEATFTAAGKISISHRPDKGGNFTPLPAPPPAETSPLTGNRRLEFALFDGAAHVRIDNTEVLTWPYVDAHPGRLIDPDNAPAFQVEFGSRGGPMTFSDVFVGRDIFYYVLDRSVLSGREFLAIPKGKYFAIGDNTGNSKDGRIWKQRVVKLKDGTEIVGDYESVEHYETNRPDGLIRFRDIEGTDHFYKPEDVLDNGDMAPRWHPFVSREELVGKALIVWWPPPRFKVIR